MKEVNKVNENWIGGERSETWIYRTWQYGKSHDRWYAAKGDRAEE